MREIQTKQLYSGEWAAYYSDDPETIIAKGRDRRALGFRIIAIREKEMTDHELKAYALKRPNGRLAMSSVGSPVWYADRERAEEANRYAWGGENEVVEVILERDCACYNGYFVKEVMG